MHKLEARIEKLQNEARSESRYGKTLFEMLDPILRMEAAKKEAVEKEAAENLVARVIFIMSYFYF
jgi:F0F1-type ATP synthase gamma subunit